MEMQQLPTLNRTLLQGEDRALADAAGNSPITVLQIGEGNFLRGFIDWMLHECRKQGRYAGSIAVTQPRPSGRPKIEALTRQDGLYTLVTRGLVNGEPTESREILSSFREAIDPYAEWKRFLAIAESPELQLVVSNTTEAGLRYVPEALTEGEPLAGYPAKAAYLLYRRYQRYEGAADRGLVFLPCELLERNGDELLRCVLQHSEDWGLPDAFRDWVKQHNRFINSLVDRIVTGHPGEQQAETWFADWGYRDSMVNTAEPYHFWAIEAEDELGGLLPLRAAGMNVVWTQDLKPYQTRKVRILNGAHTLMTPIALLNGLESVRETMNHAELSAFVRATVRENIIPVLPMAEEELHAYADSVFERFLNPFIHHRLADIAMNTISKFRTRLLPTIEAYRARGEEVPDRLAYAVAGLLRYYRVKRTDSGDYEGQRLDGVAYQVRDDAGMLAILEEEWRAGDGSPTAARLLGRTELWGQDLTKLPGLLEQVERYLTGWERAQG
jgi:tagaturonate reductase